MSEKKGGCATSRVTTPLKWHCPGGKHYLAKRIVEMLPPHIHFVEPYAGGLSVLLAKDSEGVSEVVNDIHKDLIGFWSVLQGGETFRQFHRLCEATPFSQAQWEEAALEFAQWPEPCEEVSDRVVRAWRFFVWCRQSLAGRMKSFAPLSRTRTRRGMSEQASAWLTTIEGLPLVHERLKRVVILCGEALDVIRQQDGPGTLFYLDCPYLHETRASTDDYTHEMSPSQHAALLNVLEGIKGKFILSGYRSDLYDAAALRNGWRRVDFDIANHAAGGTEKRRMTECAWCNDKGTEAA